ncbi:LytTR family DNA-binding domain-containing protein [Thomasclavelia sp.]|uniref:LytR/AlgR family response regulator transcription factor n=1 Tax=Thomasclavelia sp. TaxID=3025757 RepID=UPI0025D8CA8F|nr:LytTR family DNA-binding domain-containing protein [Thomasclavelia sp.]
MKLVIIDDDSKFAKLMKDDLLIHFSDYDEDVEIDIIDDHFSNLINIKQYLFYFIDIDLKEINGYDLARQIRASQENCYIIFVSACNDLIHGSYNLRAYYFIRKTSYQEDLKVFYSIIDHDLKIDDKFIQLNHKANKTKISLNQIIFLESQDHKVKVVTTNGIYYDNRTLKMWFDILTKDNFIQIHRSFIINVYYLNSYKKDTLIMSNNEALKIGRVYRKRFDQFYQEYLLR